MLNPRAVRANTKDGIGPCDSILWINFFCPASWNLWILMFKMNTIDAQRSWTESTNNADTLNDINKVCSRCLFCEKIACLLAKTKC
ncbi:hypothetical protein BDR04DRAFT_53253 [Suillus decipiens]|nr:hypothetical protein BDR04DRAFT_53253 [Suillus decipiens]